MDHSPLDSTRVFICAVFVSLFLVSSGSSQIQQFPYVQNFDSVTPPLLPVGWTTTINRTASGDFKTTASTARSAPNAIVDSNATVSQSLVSPLFDFTGRTVDSLEFHVRRTSAHNSGLLVEASTDGGASFAVLISDTLTNPGVTTYVRRAYALPPVLDNQQSVKIQWRVLGDGTGGQTTTIRFDDIRLTVKILHDVGPTRVEFLPQFPFMGDTVRARATIKNFGLQPAENFLVAFFEDRDHDSIPQTSELFDSVRVPGSIGQNDSTTVLAVIPDVQGEKHIIAQTIFPNDEDPSNDRAFADLSVGVRPFSVVVNEVMYAPVNPESEWLEVINTTSDSIDLRQWVVSDRNTASRSVITTADFLLPPGRFAVVAKDSAAVVSIHPDIPARVFNVPSLAAFNNDSDAVVIFDHREIILDSVHYRSMWGGMQGRSLERVASGDGSNLQTNWGSSTNPSRSTPGKKNSLTQKDIDVAIPRISFSPTAPVVGDNLLIRATVKNAGRLPVPNVVVEFFEDTDADSLPSPQELLSRQTLGSIVAGDSLPVSAQKSSLEIGKHRFIARASVEGDEDSVNNILHAALNTGYVAGTVVINEVMYAPAGGEPEWVELYNVSAESLSVKNWKLGNRNTSSRYAITDDDVIVHLGEYVVLTKDTALFFTGHPGVSSPVIQVSPMPTFLFNNSGDAVVLLDNRGARMDSVYYSLLWGGTDGRSLERVDERFRSDDSTNWGSSQDPAGSTPGAQNSVTPVVYDLRAARVRSQADFSNVTVTVVVTNVGREVASDFSVLLFHDANGDSLAQSQELLERRTTATNLKPHDSLDVEFIWNNPGRGRKAVIAEIEFTADLRSSNNMAYGVAELSYGHNSFIVNEIMFAPSVGQCEYIELYNRSDGEIDLSDWLISDMRDVTGKANEIVMTKRPHIIQPRAYVLVSADSSVLHRFGIAPDSADGVHVFIVNKTGLNLNNDVDDIVLHDLTGTVIDSIRYDTHWHNAQIADVTGRSLERINPELSTTDRRNWSTSANPVGGTPGARNSIFTATLPSSVTLSFSPNPFSPDGDGYEDFTMISYEIRATAALLRIRIYDARGRLVRTLVNAEPTGARGSVVWDGMNDDRNRVRMGIYIVLLEALDASGAEIHAAKSVVVVAVKL